jgi:hypothetical protein
MDDPAVVSAAWWLSVIHAAKIIGGLLMAVGAVGVAIEFLGDWIAVPFQRTVDKAREMIITRLNNETESLKAENLKLQTTMRKAQLPRRIVMQDRDGDKEIRAARLQEVAKYAGTSALIQAVPDFESQILASDIRFVLGRSGWNATIIDEAQSHIPSGMLMEGVRVVTLEPWPFTPEQKPVPNLLPVSPAGRAAQAVVDLLSLDLGAPHGPQLYGVHWSPEYTGSPSAPLLSKWGFEFPEGAVVILVGMKPMDYSLPPAAPQQESAEKKDK